MTVKRYLTAIGDPNLVNTASSLPYFFLKYGKDAGFLDEGLALKPEKLKIQRLFWNFFLWARTGEKGGFQYSQYFLKNLFMQVDLPETPMELISFFPLLPPMPWKQNWQVNYYIDATLMQNFQDYGISMITSERIREKALKQERKNYNLAERIICRSRWAAQSVVEDYGIAPKKVHVIHAGANMVEENVKSLDLSVMPPMHKIRLGFIGKDWKRKGLLYVLDIADLLDRQHIPIEVVVIGPLLEDDLPKRNFLKYMGFIDKTNEMGHFIDLVKSFHFGCLFSTAEAFGISNLECLRLGVPVLGFKTGGIQEAVPKGSGFLFEVSDPATKVSDLIQLYFKNPEKYYSLRKSLIMHAKDHSWENTVLKFKELWNGSEKYKYVKI